MGFIECAGAAAGGVATAVGRGMSGLGRIGTEAPAVVSAPVCGLSRIGSGGFSFVKEGPVSSLEGFAPMAKVNLGNLDLAGGVSKPGLDLGGEILFQAKPQASGPAVEMNEASVLAGVEHILAQARIPEPTVKAEASIIRPRAEPIIAPQEARAVKAEPKVQNVAEVKTQTAQTVLAVVKQAEAEQESEQAVEEVREEEKVNEAVEEELIKERRIIVEDKEVAAQRKYDIKSAVREAVILAVQQGIRKISGVLIAKLLPVEYFGVRSQVIKKKGPDGSYQETVEAIASSGEFASEWEAVKQAILIAEEKKPVKLDKEGTPVKMEDVVRVLKYRPVKTLEIRDEVIRREVKKKNLKPEEIFPKRV